MAAFPERAGLWCVTALRAMGGLDMKRELANWVVLGSVLGLTLGALGSKSVWGPPVILVAIGGLLGVGAGGVVPGIHRALRWNSGVTDYASLGGALAGTVVGGIVGRQSGLGRTMIAIFNPQLPPQDFAGPFGMMGGMLIGAFGGAIVTSGIYRICRRKVPPHSKHDDDAAASDS